MANRSTAAGQGEDFENSKAAINNSSGNGSGSATNGSTATSSALAHRATGPRTRKGKERSKYNAQKHGIFSEEVVLNGERRELFESLLNGLRKTYKPVDTFENVWVIMLAELL